MLFVYNVFFSLKYLLLQLYNVNILYCMHIWDIRPIPTIRITVRTYNTCVCFIILWFNAACSCPVPVIDNKVSGVLNRLIISALNRLRYHNIINIYKECGSLRSPTPCLCIDFICVSTAWKVTACMVHQSQSVHCI